jgi:hypothetical protein
MSRTLASFGVPRILSLEKKSPQPYHAPRAVMWDDQTIRGNITIPLTTTQRLDVTIMLFHMRSFLKFWSPFCNSRRCASDGWRIAGRVHALAHWCYEPVCPHTNTKLYTIVYQNYTMHHLNHQSYSGWSCGTGNP